MERNLLLLQKQELEEKSEKTRQYVQRDLEDQIEEEYTKRGKQYQRTQKQEKMAISTKEVAKLLKEGYTRYKKDDKGYGSIQEKYDLSGLEVVELFTTPSIKYMKTVFPRKGLEIIDDLNNDEVVLEELTQRIVDAIETPTPQVVEPDEKPNPRPENITNLFN